MTWTDDRVATLKQFWNDGFSAAQIAAKLGDLTRNAVIGKVHRLGLPGRAENSRHVNSTPGRSARRTRRSPARRRRPRGTIRFGRHPSSVRPERPAIMPELGPAPKICVTVQRLTILTCRWPEGDPKAADFHFCGRTKQRVNIPYCDHHDAIAHR